MLATGAGSRNSILRSLGDQPPLEMRDRPEHLEDQLAGASRRWPCRSIASTKTGTSGRSRLPQIRSDASQITISASRVASS
jgi:hypothetical protein